MIDIDLLDAELSSLFGRNAASERKAGVRPGKVKARGGSSAATTVPASATPPTWTASPSPRASASPAAPASWTARAAAAAPAPATQRAATATRSRTATPAPAQPTAPAWTTEGRSSRSGRSGRGGRTPRGGAFTRTEPAVEPPAAPLHAPAVAPPDTVLTVPPRDLREAAAWDTMRGLLDGKRAEAQAALETMAAVARNAADAATWDRYWTQRFWVGLEWGGVDEQHTLLDHCRERAYRFSEPVWRGALALHLARLGRSDEAARELDAASGQLERVPLDPDARLDLATTLAETAFRLDDARRATLLGPALAQPTEPVLLLRRPWICKGAIARYRGLVAAATRNWPIVDDQLRLAVEIHRRLGAGPLLARTLQEWGKTLIGRDDALAHHCLGESAALASRLELVALPAQPS